VDAGRKLAEDGAIPLGPAVQAPVEAADVQGVGQRLGPGPRRARRGYRLAERFDEGATAEDPFVGRPALTAPAQGGEPFPPAGAVTKRLSSPLS